MAREVHRDDPELLGEGRGDVRPPVGVRAAAVDKHQAAGVRFAPREVVDRAVDVDGRVIERDGQGAPEPVRRVGERLIFGVGHGVGLRSGRSVDRRTRSRCGPESAVDAVRSCDERRDGDPEHRIGDSWRLDRAGRDRCWDVCYASAVRDDNSEGLGRVIGQRATGRRVRGSTSRTKSSNSRSSSCIPHPVERSATSSRTMATVTASVPVSPACGSLAVLKSARWSSSGRARRKREPERSGGEELGSVPTGTRGSTTERRSRGDGAEVIERK